MLPNSTCRALVLALVLGVLDTSCQLQNADQAGRASVKLLASSSLGLASSGVATAAARATPRHQFPPPPQIRPGPKQLRRRKLLRLLAEGSGGDRGDDGGVAAGLESGWLAVERPYDVTSQAATAAKNADQLLQDSPPAALSQAGQKELAKISQQQQWVLQQQLDELNVTEPAARRRLAQLGSCRSRWTWTDLGAEIWPRWLRGAECAGGGCGWPPGLLRCGMSGGGSGGGGGGGERKLRLLRWQCERRPQGSSSPKRKKRRNDDRALSSSTSSLSSLPSGGVGGVGGVERKSRRSSSSRSRRLAMRLSRSAGDLVCYWAPHEVRVPAEFHESAVACVCGLGSAGGGCS